MISNEEAVFLNLLDDSLQIIYDSWMKNDNHIDKIDNIIFVRALVKVFNEDFSPFKTISDLKENEEYAYVTDDMKKILELVCQHISNIEKEYRSELSKVCLSDYEKDILSVLEDPVDKISFGFDKIHQELSHNENYLYNEITTLIMNIALAFVSETRIIFKDSPEINSYLKREVKSAMKNHRIFIPKRAKIKEAVKQLFDVAENNVSNLSAIRSQIAKQLKNRARNNRQKNIIKEANMDVVKMIILNLTPNEKETLLNRLGEEEKC